MPCPSLSGRRSDSQCALASGQAHETSLFTTSVCTGSLLLGAAGLLQGLEATTHWTATDILTQFGAKPTGTRVVQQVGPEFIRVLWCSVVKACLGLAMAGM